MECPECGQETRHYVWPKNHSESGKTEDLDCCENTDCRWQRRTDRATRKVIEELTGKEQKERAFAEFVDRAAKRLGIETYREYDVGYLGKKGFKDKKILHAFWGGTDTALCAYSGKQLMADAHLVAKKFEKKKTLKLVNCKLCLLHLT